jgi:6-phosphogluconolactonase
LSADERFLYTSSRAEQNAINVYKKSGDNWQFVERVSSLGKAPRHFSLDPSNKFLLCANQNSNEIVIFNRNTSTGQLTDSGKRISTGKPVCLKWINTK